MKRIFKKTNKPRNQMDPSLITGDAVPPTSDLSTSTSTIITSATDLMQSVLDTATTASPRAIQAPGVTTAHQSQVFPPISGLEIAPAVAPLDVNSPSLPSSLPDSTTQPYVRSAESEQNISNILISGGTFVNYIHPANGGEGPTKIPVTEIPNPSPFFTGRKDVLEKLGKIFVHCSNSRPRRSCLLWGMGGIGKTQICLKFIEEMSDRFTHVFWVDASSHDSITMSLKGMCSIPAAQAYGVDGSVKSALQWISFIQEEWLIVFDNADAPEVVAMFIPSGNRGNILITSRNRSMGRIISFQNVIEIHQMEEPDAITLLLRASYLDPLPDHLKAAKMIVVELGCIPLAVNHAGAYIEAGKCDIKKYLRQFSLHRQTLMSDVTFKGASNYNQTVYGTWDLSFKEIKKRADGQATAGEAQAAQAAILILQICAFYHHSNISKDIFRSAAEESRKHLDSKADEKLPQAITLLDHTLLALDNDGQWDEFIFGQGTGVLLSFSLMKRGQSSEILSIHPLMHCWSRERMSKSEQQKMCQIGSIILSSAVTWRFTSQDYALRHLIFPHIKACQSHEMQMGFINEYFDDKYNNFALVMKENGDWNNAEQLFFHVMNMRMKLLGEEHSTTLLSMGNLANIYRNQGRWSEAEQLEIQVMDKTKRLLGVEHPHTLLSMGNLAKTYHKQGRWNQAEQLEVQVMDMQKKLLGTEHPSTLLTMRNLSNIYCNQGRWIEAEQLGVQVMDKSKKLLGAEHPDTLLSMGDLAKTYRNQGRWNQAEQLEVQVMDMSKKLLGAEHPDTVLSMGNLASTYHNQRRWNEAEQLEVQVMEKTKILLGAEHPHTLLSMANLGSTYHNQGRWNEAEQLQVQVMEKTKILLGAEHPHTLLSMANLGGTYQNQGRWNEAEQLEVQVMEIRKKLLGAEHPDTLLSMGNLASTYQNQGRLNEAEQLQVGVMEMRKKLLGAEHPYTLLSMRHLANTYRLQARWNEAEQLELSIINTKRA